MTDPRLALNADTFYESQYIDWLNRNSERIPRSLSERSEDPAAGAAGLASESKIRQNTLR